MYADKVTDSMQRAINEMQRRRKIQIAYNKQHNITPRGIAKKVHDIMEVTYEKMSATSKQRLQIAEQAAKYTAMKPQQLAKEIAKLEQQMYNYAKNLEFEAAAKIRDRIHWIKENL